MKCKANNCPMPVDFVTHWETAAPGVARAKWGVCWYHRQADPDKWTETTRRIRRNENAAIAIRAIKRDTDPVTSYMPGETVHDYVTRVSGVLDKLILGDVDPQDAAENFRKIIAMLSS